MSWFRIVMMWLGFADDLDTIPEGGESESPPTFIWLQNGKQFAISLKAKRLK